MCECEGFLSVYVVYGLAAENLRQNRNGKAKSPRVAPAIKTSFSEFTFEAMKL